MSLDRVPKCGSHEDADHIHRVTCCWCGRVVHDLTRLPRILWHGTWHKVCPMCLRHHIPYPEVHSIRLLFGVRTGPYRNNAAQGALDG